jgi:PhzF family phenazine biosynthesis protein
MQLRIYQIDAFTSNLFGGNPAAVVPLERWLDDATMQLIATENNLSDTAFFVPQDDGYSIRWFTPMDEVRLCGHATLASAFVIFSILDPGRESVTFDSPSGPLHVHVRNNRLTLDFPRRDPQPCDAPAALLHGLGIQPREVFATASDTNYYVVYESEHAVRSLQPDMASLSELHLHGVAVTAPGLDADFVSRYFAPSYGVPEDPVTGSSHCALTPYWSGRLGKTSLHARQVSRRGGELFCELHPERVLISGEAVKYMEGTIDI